MKSGVAIMLVALNTRADAATSTNGTHQLPSRAINMLDANDRLEKHGVGEMHLGYPNSTHDMNPFAAISLLVRAHLMIRTQYALNGRGRRLNAPTTQPLTLGYIRHTVALLMHCQITHVTEQDHIRVETLAVQAYAAYGVLVGVFGSRRVQRRPRTLGGLEIRLFFEPVHD